MKKQKKQKQIQAPSLLSREQAQSDYQREQEYQRQALQSVKAESRQALGKSPKMGYADKLQAISPFVNFNFKNPNKLGPKNKGKITRLYNQISKLSAGNKFVPVQGSEKQKIASQLFNQVGQYKESVKGVWIPETTIGNGELTWKGNTPVLEIPNFPEQTLYPLNQVHLASNPRKTLEALIKGAPKDAIFVPLSKKDGEMIKSTGYRNDKTTIIETILDWMENYEDAGIWLTGIKQIGTFSNLGI